jgi:NADPH:quinone reductase-like Zn-dependent oxidoreductase
VQIAKARGAEVTGTASAAKHDALAALGLDDVLDYRRERFETAVRDVDLVVDLVGGNVPFRSLQVLRPGGLLVHVVSDVLPAGLAAAAAARGVRATAFLAEPDHAALEHLAVLATAGALQVLLYDRFPLAAAAAAHDLAERTHPLGKVVLTC